NERFCTPPLPEEDVARIAASISRYESVPEPEAPPKEGIIPYENYYSMMTETTKEPDWILEGWMVKGDCAILAGDPGAGKSFLAMDLALAGAAGLSIWDHFLVPHPFRTLLIDEENPRDEVHRRIYKISQARGLKPQDVEDRLRITVPRHGFTFRKEECRK